MLDQGRQQYGAIIGDGEISGFVGFDIYIYIYIFFFTGVFGSSLHGFFGV